MAKYSDRPISGMDKDWARDPSNGLPYSGQSVQNFIKNTFNSKVGSGYFDSQSMTLYLFKDEVDKSEFLDDNTRLELVLGSIPMNFETTQYRIHINTDGSTTVNATVNQEDITLGMSLRAERRELGEASWTPTGQDIGVRVYVDANSTGVYEEIPQLAQTVLSSNGQLSVDILPYIPTGTSRVRFYFYATNDASLSSSVVWTVTLAEMYIEEWGNNWHEALVESGPDNHYRLGGFKIVGTIAKTLHIDISTPTAVVASYSRDIAQLEAIDSPYSFTRNEGLDLSSPVSADGTPLPALATGIYNVRVWLTSGDLSTEDSAIVYSIMYIAAGDEYTAQLVVMNNSGNEVNNYDESAHLCDYAIYNAGSTYGTPEIAITPYIAGTAGTSAVSNPETFTEQKQELRYNISLVTNSTNLTIRYRITMPGNYQENVSAVDNSEIFPSEDGATFYLNTSLRSNGEANKEQIINTATTPSAPLSEVQWEKMSWVDGIDGWTVDDEGRKCLFLPARTKLTIPPSAFRFLTGENVTFELCYKVANVSDYSKNIITIAQNPDDEGFMGIRIKPTNVTIHSGSDSTSGNDIYQGTNIADEETVHLLITIQNSFGSNSGYNLVTGYVNGCKNFQFSYTSGTIWANTYANAIFGCDSADLYLYMVRVYGRALSAAGAEGNWLNSMTTRSEKVLRKSIIQSVLAPSSRQIDYETIKNSGKYNFFVIEMTSGSSGIPTTSYPDGGRSNIEMHYGMDALGNSRSHWDWKIYDVETKGQGTTSMNYWLWNIRFRIDKTDGTKKRLVSYYGAPTISAGRRVFDELEPESSKVVWFDGVNNHPAVKRITAKINFASSMQSHKMGATRAYSLLHDTLEDGALLNEAQVIASNNHQAVPTVAVYQYPAFGFQKTVDSLGHESYSFIGLFTIGPDKGDKPTFGFDLVEDDLISMEGTDHTPQMAKFNVPWDEQTGYFVNSSGDGFLATKAPQGTFVNALEVGSAKTADTKIASDSLAVLVESFKDAYDVVYDNSTLIFPIALDDESFGGENATAESILANINANIETFQNKSYDGRLSYKDMEFWIEGEYKLYHYEYESQSYVSGYKENGEYNNPLDLRTDTGVTNEELQGLMLEEQNELFRQVRRERFKNAAPTYWDMRELAFNYDFLLIFGATDNFAKNQYPYYMGGKWRFRQDDLDTIEDIDNNGGQTKSPYIEFNDSVSGSPVFAGSNSILWNLVNETLWADYTVDEVDYPGLKTVGREILEKMSELANGDNTHDGFIKFFEKYFWGNAQEYFPQSAYNIDGNLKYEGAWLTGRRFSVDPLRQSLGDHYSAERLWVRRRALYCMSLFGAGPFGDYRDRPLVLGSVQFRPDGLGTMTVTPAVSMYPCLIVGANDIRPTGRTPEGTEYTFTSLVDDGNTTYTLQAIHYLTSLGDLKDLQLGPDDGGLFNLSGKRLVTFKMGDEDASNDNVTTTVKTLRIDSENGLPCLEVLDVRNASQLTGALDLTTCRRLKEVYTEGTKVASVILPRGSKIEKLHLSDEVTSLSYQVVKYLSDLVLPSDSSNITLIYLDECDALNGMQTLETIYNSENQTLSFIRLIWGTEQLISGKQLRMLNHIMQNKDKNNEIHNYNGVDLSGSGNVNMNPHIEGLLVASAYYPSDLEALAGSYEPIDSPDHEGMKRILCSYFGQLILDYPIGDAYEFIEFTDKNVEALCVSSFDTAHLGGLTKARAASVTNITARFQGNTQITSFNELANFTSMTEISATGSGNTRGAFNGCTSLEEITLPNAPSRVTVGNQCFQGCTNLKVITIIQAFSSDSSGTSRSFWQCSKLKRINIPSIAVWMNCYIPYGSLYSNPFQSSGEGHLYINGVEVTEVEVPSTRTGISGSAFYKCKGITKVDIPSGVSTIGTRAFQDCTALVALIVRADTPPSLGSDALTGTNANLKIYVPYSSDHSILQAYQAASGWSSYSTKMYELDENGEIPSN